MRIRIASCQLNTVVGDLEGNIAKVLEAIKTAESTSSDIAVFPELSLTGYPPEDLLLKPRFINQNLEAIHKVAAQSGDCVAVVGFVDAGLDLYNAAAICWQGKIIGIYHKQNLPNYAVFDEQRYFMPGNSSLNLYKIAGVNVGVSICEDLWSPQGPLAQQAAGGAEVVVNLNASPYFAGRFYQRERMLATRASDASAGLVYVNQVGGQDELVFDGTSVILDENGSLVARANQFKEEIMITDLEVREVFRKRLLDPRGRHFSPLLDIVEVSTVSRANGLEKQAQIQSLLNPEEEVYEALVMGTRDYVNKNNFTDVVIGLSGGIDSALVATIATDALGPQRVHAVAMPSRFSSDSSEQDASQLASNLGIELKVISIEKAHNSFLEMLSESFRDTKSDLTEENLQSRIRGVILMALSNKFSWMVLTTGNKSEVATGYSTLYGDSAGGFAVIKDVPKTLVYKLSKYRNSKDNREIIPVSIIEKAPSAELRPNQKDEDSLPPYELLDPILNSIIEKDMTSFELKERGFPSELVDKVVALVDRAEYKRRQSPPGVRVSPKAFGKDRRVPITNRYPG